MDNTCYSVIVRQQMCQSGIPVIRENVYSNIESNTTIALLNGYSLSFTPSTGSLTNISFINQIFDISLSFTIANNSIAIFDLPIENSIFRVTIFVQTNACQENKCCRNSSLNNGGA